MDNVNIYYQSGLGAMNLDCPEKNCERAKVLIQPTVKGFDIFIDEDLLECEKAEMLDYAKSKIAEIKSTGVGTTPGTLHYLPKKETDNMKKSSDSNNFTEKLGTAFMIVLSELTAEQRKAILAQIKEYLDVGEQKSEVPQ